jgi:hypothetical protein
MHTSKFSTGRGLPNQILVSMKMSERDAEDELRRQFQLFDDGGTGQVSIKALKKAAKEAGDDISDEELHSMIEMVGRLVVCVEPLAVRFKRRWPEYGGGGGRTPEELLHFASSCFQFLLKIS